MKKFLCAFMLTTFMFTCALQARGTLQGIPQTTCKIGKTSTLLKYNHGTVIAIPRVTSVLWNYLANPDDPNDIPTMLEKFLPDLLTSDWCAGFSEYRTNHEAGVNTNQPIRKGFFVGQKTIFPQSGNTTVTDDEIQQTLIANIQNGSLPAPHKGNLGNNQSVYLISFPPGYTVDATSIGNGMSCSSFCGYHNSVLEPNSGITVAYAVLPRCDLNSCGFVDSDIVKSFEVVVSHELAEIITDPIVPEGWDNDPIVEVADICENESAGQITVGNNTWSVAKLWSNRKRGCVDQLPGFK